MTTKEIASCIAEITIHLGKEAAINHGSDMIKQFAENLITKDREAIKSGSSHYIDEMTRFKVNGTKRPEIN